MAAARVSWSVLRGGGALGPPTAPRGAPGTSFVSVGRAEAELISVNRPVLPSSAKVVTVPSNSLNTYTNLLSAEITKWRGPVDGFSSTSAGVLDDSRPDFSSN